MGSREWQRYEELCLHCGETVPVFSQSWWIEAVSEKRETSAIYAKAESSAPIALPYVITKKMGLRLVLMPQLTQFFSPTSHSETRPTDNTGLLAELLGHFRRRGVSIAQLRTYLTEQEAKEAEELGFEAKPRTSYKIRRLDRLDRIESLFSPNNKRLLNRASGLRERDKMSPNEFYDFVEANLRKRGKQPTYSRHLLTSLIEVAMLHGSAKIICIEDEQARPYAAALIVWDAHTCYYLVPTYDKDLAKSGAMTLATLRSIQFAQSKGLVFDFEGSDIKPIAQAYRHYGGQPETYYELMWYRNDLVKWGFRSYLKIRKG